MQTTIIDLQPNDWHPLELAAGETYIIENISKNTIVYYSWGDKPNHSIGHILNFGDKITKNPTLSDNVCWLNNHTQNRIMLAMTTRT